MSDPVNGPDAARLNELADVTRAYARYSGPSSGLAATLIGAWILAAEWVLARAPRAGELLFAFGPLVWITAVSFARRFYQRHGEVVGNSDDERWLRSNAYRATIMIGLFMSTLVAIDKQFREPRRGSEMLVVAALVAAAMLSAWLLRTISLVFTMSLVIFAGQAVEAAAAPAWYSWSRIGIGVGFIGLGIFDHFRYRRLERRLAKLKGRG